MDELLEQFIIEAGELVQQAADDLLALEREPASKPHIESLFRGVHTLKGSAGIFDFAPIQRTLFAAEDILTAANRAGELDTGMVDPLIAVIEWTDRCVKEIASRGSLPADATETGMSLIAALSSRHVEASAPAEAAAVPAWASHLFDAHPAANCAIRYVPRPDCFFSGDDPVALISGVPDLLAVNIGTVSAWPEPCDLDPFRCNLTFEAASASPLSQIAGRFRLLPDQVTLVARPRAEAAHPHGPQARRTVRVDVARVDTLVDMVGELFIAKNAISRIAQQLRQVESGLAMSRSIAATEEELDRLAHRIHRAALGVRMVPLNETLRRLPRLVREISGQLGKPIDLQVEGGEVEADKSVVDGLFDPLLHALRNAIDHGIEQSATREERGKPQRGRVSVRARQAGFRIEVEVADDGGGVDIEAVRAMAIARGIVTADRAAGLDENGVIELLFQSGFSTAGKVSDVSGRGVGMDAVRRDVEKMGGRVSLSSRPGEGVGVRMSMPTSFAVSRIMIVEVGSGRYALPMDCIAETTRIEADAINAVRSGEAMILRGRTLPVVRLAPLLGMPMVRRQQELLLILDVAGVAMGLVVDAIGERLDAMLRPAAGIIKLVPGVSGTTVMGDGSVVLVLDMEALIR